jgi:hypothetical protein
MLATIMQAIDMNPRTKTTVFPKRGRVFSSTAREGRSVDISGTRHRLPGRVFQGLCTST